MTQGANNQRKSLPGTNFMQQSTHSQLNLQQDNTLWNDVPCISLNDLITQKIVKVKDMTSSDNSGTHQSRHVCQDRSPLIIYSSTQPLLLVLHVNTAHTLNITTCRTSLTQRHAHILSNLHQGYSITLWQHKNWFRNTQYWNNNSKVWSWR